MQDTPKAEELVGAVREFLQSALQTSDAARTAFLTRVAINALGIVERELALGPDLDAAERDRLRALLDLDGTIDQLNRELCKRIRDGHITTENPLLMPHLRATALAKLSIDQPKYSGYLAALKK